MSWGLAAAAGIAGAASLIGGQLGGKNERENIEKQQNFEHDMSNTAYQRAVADMKEAGLNPMLAYKLGGASTPGAVSDPGNLDTITPAVSSANAVYKAGKEADMIDANVKLTESAANKNNAEAGLAVASVPKVQAEARLHGTSADDIFERIGLTIAQRMKAEHDIGPARLADLKSQYEENVWDDPGKYDRLIPGPRGRDAPEWLDYRQKLNATLTGEQGAPHLSAETRKTISEAVLNELTRYGSENEAKMQKGPVGPFTPYLHELGHLFNRCRISPALWEVVMRVPFIRTPYNYDVDAVSAESGLVCPDPSLAVQSERDECDINVIVKRFGITGELPQNLALPVFADFDEIFDFQTAQNAVIRAQGAFNQVPADIRARFGNNPQAFVAFCSDPDNSEELVRLGLAKAPEVAAFVPPIVVAPEKGVDK